VVRDLRPRAILLALALFVVLYFGGYLLTKTLVREISHVHTRLMWLNALTYLTWIICGFFSGVIAHRLGTVHGAIFGVLSNAIVVALFTVFTGTRSLVHLLQIEWFIMTTILGATGGFIWDVYNWLRTKTSNKVLKRDAA
jgi:hypothetical protein